MKYSIKQIFEAIETYSSKKRITPLDEDIDERVCSEVARLMAKQDFKDKVQESVINNYDLNDDQLDIIAEKVDLSIREICEFVEVIGHGTHN